MSKERLLELHESVLCALEEKVNSDNVASKDIELAMKFLKDNNIQVDLTNTSVQAARAKLAIIPRLTEEELKLG